METLNSNRLMLKREDGSTPVIIICSTIFVLLFSALITDVGYSAIQQYRLSQIAKDVVCYGAEQLAVNRANAKQIIKEYAVKKVNDLNKLDVKISDNHKEISVYMGRKFRYIFLKKLGYEDKQIESYATAHLSVVSSIKGIRPFAVEKQKFIYQKKYILSKKEMKGTVRFVPVDLGDGSFKVDILYGNREVMSVGSQVKALPNVSDEVIEKFLENLLKKNNHKPAYSGDNYVKNRINIIELPVVDKIKGSGESTMKIMGFAAFFVEGVKEEKGNVLIEGRFIKHTVNASTSDGIDDYGLMGIKMLQ